jgi:hypothetical protein
VLTSPPPIPAGQSELTPGWLTQVLRRAGAIEAGCVTEVSVEPAGQGYSWDRCWTDYRRYAYQCLAFLVPATMLVERTARGDAMFLAMIRRGCTHIIDLESAALI